MRKHKTENPEHRSRVMATVRSKRNRSTEWRLRGALVALGICGWKLTAGNLPGRPDFAFAKQKLAVFVDGCFWHGCLCCYRRPKSRQNYWDKKIQRNISRDKQTRALLRKRGWRVVRIWEHELEKGPKRCAQHIQRLLLESR